MRVDDFLGAGEGVSCLADLQANESPEQSCFLSRMQQLSRRFRFGAWAFGSKMRFCGADLVQSQDRTEIEISLKEYVLKIKPISMEKSRKTMVDDYCMRRAQAIESFGRSHVMAHNAMPSTKFSSHQPVASKHPQAHGEGHARGQQVSQIPEGSGAMKIRRHCDLKDLRVGVYSDAAWAVRPDGSSQGGMLTFIASEAELQSAKPFPLTVIDWHSKKLVRMRRSSLSAEAQASSLAVDELEWMKVFMSSMVNPYVAIEKDESTLKFGESPVLTDA